MFDAWDVARADIASAWDLLTDPNNLLPPVPKAMRDAEELVRSNPNNALTNVEIQDLSGRLLSNYSPRIWRPFRRALNEDTPADQIEEIRRLVDQFALTVPTRPAAADRRR